MPAVGPALTDLFKNKVNDYMKTAYPYDGPLAGQITSYYEEFCMAIATGIVNKSLDKIKFKSIDVGIMGVPPVPGTGVGKGIFVDSEWFSENLYKKLMTMYEHLPPYPPATKTTRWVDPFGIEHENVEIVHPPFPPNSDYSNGMFVECITQGLADAVKEHYETAWILSSSHSMVYLGAGEIKEGMFSGLNPAEISGEIIKLAGSLSGPFWAKFAQAVGEVYVEAIHNHSEGGTVKIFGVCVPTPIPPQVCGIPGGGAGSGDAL